ncbi:MAG: rod shape-determining protein RodA [Patescibacteria group bacterium]|nr:rod shape-determining protein RodA [Patescibacteria group bacterium]
MKQIIFKEMDWWLVTPVFMLILLGLTTLFSINISFFKSQFLFFILSLFVFIFFSQVNYKIIRLYAVPIYLVSLVLLFMVLLLGIESRGAIRWVDILGLRIQFSEILKPFLAVVLASFLSSEAVSIKTFVLTIFLFIPIFLLIAMQPDLGSALLYLASLTFTLCITGFPIVWFLGALLPVIGGAPLVWHFLHGYQRQRIMTFINPTKDPLGSSYNAIQSIIAVGSGMIFGKGFGQTTQSGLRFLPERHTDFIFASIAESLGFVGVIILFALFVLFLYRLFLIFSSSEDRFCKIFLAGAFSLFLIEFFMNVGMSIGILPIVGVTLPFVSYGGSSLLSNFILLGIVVSIGRNAKKNKALEIR